MGHMNIRIDPFSSYFVWLSVMACFYWSAILCDCLDSFRTGSKQRGFGKHKIQGQSKGKLLITTVAWVNWDKFDWNPWRAT